MTNSTSALKDHFWP